MLSGPNPEPAKPSPPGVTLRWKQRFLLVFALFILVPALVLTVLLLPYILCLTVPLVAVSGLLFWASLACALALARTVPYHDWLDRDCVLSFLALVGSTLFSSALAAVGLIAVAGLAALFFIGQILLLWRRRLVPALAQVGVVCLCLVLIPLVAMAKVPGADVEAGRFNDSVHKWLFGPDAGALKAQKQKDLMQAARSGNLDEIKRLLAQGADSNAPDFWGATALSVAEPRAAELLLRFKADPNHRDSHGRTAFLGAMREGDPETLKLLVAHGADIQARDSVGRTALLTLIENAPSGSGEFLVGGRSYRIAEWLISQGVPLDARTSEKSHARTTAAEAASRLDLSQLQALLEGHPCPALFGRPEIQPMRSKWMNQRAALLSREPTIENRYSFYRTFRGSVLIMDEEEAPPGAVLLSFRWGPVALVPGKDGFPLLVLSGDLPLETPDLPAHSRRVDALDLVDLAAAHGAGLLVKSGFGPGDPAVVVPPADISLIRRCGGG
ncbi:MAG TPA: ankyrin repeat domain-containing protein [Thermoanaerobaculia bacterium]